MRTGLCTAVAGIIVEHKKEGPKKRGKEQGLVTQNRYATRFARQENSWGRSTESGKISGCDLKGGRGGQSDLRAFWSSRRATARGHEKKMKNKNILAKVVEGGEDDDCISVDSSRPIFHEDSMLDQWTRRYRGNKRGVKVKKERTTRKSPRKGHDKPTKVQRYVINITADSSKKIARS